MSLLSLRRPVQIAALLLFIGLPWCNQLGFEAMRGSLFAFDFFGIPFADPLGPAQLFLMGLLPGWRLLAGGLGALLIAACFGRIFCSWLCPMGFLSESIQRCRKRPLLQTRHDFHWRCGITGLGLLLCVLLGIPLLNQLSLPGTLSLGLLNLALPASVKTEPALLESIVFYGAPFGVIGVVLLLEWVFGRFWCRFLCPQSVLLSLAAALPFGLRLRRNLRRCTCPSGEKACAVCPLGLNPRSARSASPVACTNCGVCVLACQSVHPHEPAALFLSHKEPPENT